MKVNEILNIESVITKHTDHLTSLFNKEVDDLSISELSFIKMVSSGSITTMKKNGASNEKILRTDKRIPLSDEMKIKIYLKSLTPEQLTSLMDEVH